MGVLTLVSKDTILEIKQAVNIVDIIGEVVSLSKTGRNFLGLCPFHGEKTPSFNVNEEKQFYHCFGCGKSGDVFKFLEEYRGISFVEAVQYLGNQIGLDLTDVTPSAQRTQRQHPHQELIDLHEDARKFYHAYLMTTKMGEEARQYLYHRGLTDEIIKHFQLGLSPSEGNYFYQSSKDKFSEQVLVDSGLFTITESNHMFDAFQNRIMFPLTNDEGKVIAFSGRIWKEETSDKHVAKYKNSRGTVLFNKSYELYHLDQARPSIKKDHEVYLMEGFLDVIAAYRSGIENAVASMGTALTREHVSHLKRYTKKVILAYDGDKAGQHAIQKALEELSDLTVEIVRFPQGMDPDEYLQKNSPQALSEFLRSNRISHIEFLLHYLKPDNIDNLQAQIEFLDQMAPLIANVESITAQNTYIYMLNDLLTYFEYGQIESAVNDSRLAKRQERRENRSNGNDRTYDASGRSLQRELPVQQHIPPLVRVETHLLHRMIHHPLILNDYRLQEDFQFETPEFQNLYQILCESGEITSLELSQVPDNVQQAWYRVLELDLPEEVSEVEMAELEVSRNREMLRRLNQQIVKDIRVATQTGDVDTALEEVERLIAQKRRME